MSFRGLRPVPVLDFKKYIVVGVFWGSEPAGGYQIVFGAPSVKNGNLIVTYSVRQSTGFATDVITQPFRFNVFAKPSGKVEIREVK